MKTLLFLLLICNAAYSQNDCGYKYFGTTSKVYIRLEEAPNHKKDKEDSFLIKGFLPIYFIEDSAKFYIGGYDTLLVYSYEVRGLLGREAKEPLTYIFHAYQEGHYEIIVYPEEVMIVPEDQSAKRKWPSLYRIFTINK